MPNTKTVINPFSIAPLSSDVELAEYDRLPNLVNSISNEIGYSKGGCFLITGYRGVGKTSFLNKVLQTTDEKLSEKTIILPVRLSLARGYSTNKLLRRLIREMFYALTKSEIYKSLDPVSRKQADIAFLRTSHQVKTGLAQGLKHAITHHETEARRDSMTGKIGVEHLTGAFASFDGKKEIEKSTGTSETNEKSSELGIELEFLEYDDEIAETDLANMIDLLHNTKVKVGEESETITTQRKRRPMRIWELIARVFPNTKMLIETSEIKKTDIYKSIKLIFVLDEIDKMSFAEADRIFRSLKNLFLQGNAFFFVVAGKAFHYEWLRKRTSEDDIFFSIFTRIVHIPLFNKTEFDQVAKRLSDRFPDNLLTHLKYKAKGTPREFFRELSPFVDWSEAIPNLLLLDSAQKAIKISEKLYPIIQEEYAAFENDERIEIGIRDHLRRSLHNWLEWMTILVTFTKSSVLRPKTEGESDDTLFFGRTRLTFDKLFDTMLSKGILEDTGQKIDEQVVYTFTQDISDDLQEVDSSIFGQLQDSALEQQKVLNQLEVEFHQKLDQGEFDEAKNLLSKLAEYAPKNRLGDSSYSKELKAYETMQQGDILFGEKLFESAFGAYRIVSGIFPDFSGIKEKLIRTQFVMAFEQAENAKGYDAYLSARDVLYNVIDVSHEFFDTDIAQMKKEAKEKAKLFDQIIHTQDKLSRFLKAGDARAATKEFRKLMNIAPELQALEEIEEQVMSLEHEWSNLEGARQAMLEEDYESAQKYAKIAMASSNINIAQKAEEIYLRIKSITSK